MEERNPSDRRTIMSCWQVKELENELESEQKKGQEYQKIVRKYERRIKELSYQVKLQTTSQATYSRLHVCQRSKKNKG